MTNEERKKRRAGKDGCEERKRKSVCVCLCEEEKGEKKRDK